MNDSDAEGTEKYKARMLSTTAGLLVFSSVCLLQLCSLNTSDSWLLTIAMYMFAAAVPGWCFSWTVFHDDYVVRCLGTRWNSFVGRAALNGYFLSGLATFGGTTLLIATKSTGAGVLFGLMTIGLLALTGRVQYEAITHILAPFARACMKERSDLSRSSPDSPKD